MSKRKTAWLAVGFVAVTAALAIVLSVYGTLDVALSEAQIQERINEKLPYPKDGVTVKRVSVYLESGIVASSIDAEGEKWKQQFAVSVQSRGTPVFNPLEGSFHFRPSLVQITNLEIKDEAVSEKVEKFIDRFVDSPKISRNKEAIAKEIEKWVRGSIERTTVLALERMPIYTLPNTLKGNVFRMMLKSVEVHEESLALHLSFWQFTKMVILYAVIFLIALATTAALLMNPEWGLPLLAISSLGDN